MVKTCSKCKQDKAAEGFRKNHAWCKECRKEYDKAYYQQNSEKLKERQKAYRKQNREKIKEYKKTYHKENREKIKEYKKAYHKQNPEKIKKHCKAYYKQNRDKISEQQKAYRKQNRDKISEQQKAYRKQNRDKISERKKAYYQQNCEKINEKQKAYHKQNREKKKEYDKAYHKQNREKIRERRKAYHKQNRDKARIYQNNKRKTDINYKLSGNLRKRVRDVLKGELKSKNTLKLLGCSVVFLKKHLESQFQPGMSWNNYGNPNGDHSECWHVDHILPCASFDLSDPKQQQKCFHYTNLQPLWAEDNLSKGAKLDYNFPE